MPRLQGSCHCGRVRFEVVSHTPEPYQNCYCTVCRKTQGGGGHAIVVMGEADTLEVTGEEHLAVYRAGEADRHGSTPGAAARHFCRHCASNLFLRDDGAPKWVYPFASAIDTALPVPPERTHIRLYDKAPWVEVLDTPEDLLFGDAPDETIEGWHRRTGLYRAD